MSKFTPLTVTDVSRETRDSVVVTLAPPQAQRAAFGYIQGQYLTLRTTLDGEEVRRSYSICSAVQDQALQVGIKRVQGGRFSTWANEILRPGDRVDAMPPMGNFYTTLAPDNRKHYAGFAAGSGITPILGIAKTTLLTEPASSFSLFYGNRASSSIMFREALEDLKNRFLGRLNLIHILSREQQDIELFNGRINRAKCDALFDQWLDISTVDTAFICGPQSMMLEVSDALRAHGLDKSRIKFELFGTQTRSEQRADSGRDVSEPSTGTRCEATVKVDGRSHSFSLEKGSESLLDAALNQGTDLPYACKGGVCSTCRALLLEGEVDMDANFALEDYEIARGYILTCQSYPVTDRLVVDFDQ